jgi:hypothetical protein
VPFRQEGASQPDPVPAHVFSRDAGGTFLYQGEKGGGCAVAIVGVLAFLVALSAVLTWFGWRKNEPAPELLWEPRSFAASYTSVIGPLAAFSVASAIFMAGVSVNRQTLAFETMIGMLLVAYIVFTGTAMMFASTPGSVAGKSDDGKFLRLQRYSIAIAMLGYGVGVSIAWLTLSPLLIAIELKELADLFIWILLVTTFAASARWSLFMYRMFEVRRPAAMLMPGICLIAAGLYHLGANTWFPALWPAGNAPLTLTIVLFGIVVLGFATHSMMLNGHGAAPADRLIERHGHRMTIVAYGASTGALFLLWFALAFPDPGR